MKVAKGLLSGSQASPAVQQLHCIVDVTRMTNRHAFRGIASAAARERKRSPLLPTSGLLFNKYSQGLFHTGTCNNQSECPFSTKLLRSTTARAHITDLRRPRSSAASRGSTATDERKDRNISRTGVEGGEEGAEKLGNKSKEDGVVLDPMFEVREKQRVEVEFGTFHEFTAVNKTRGKLFEASRELIPTKDAVVFPTFAASCLAGGGAEVEFPARLTERVTMVGVFHRQFGYSMLPTWTKPFEEAFGVSGSLRVTPAVLQLSLLESWALRVLKTVLVHTMGRGLAPDKKAGFFYRFGPTDELRKALGIENRLTLYVLLVDQKGRVRWRGCGKGTPDEVASLIRCATQLAQDRELQ